LRGNLPRRAWVTGNPNGRDWVWRTFVDESRDGYNFFHAKTWENTFLPHDYIDNLRLYYPAEWVDRFCEGSFDVFEGQIFNEFSPAVHVIHPADVFPIPGEWPRFRAIDHGIHHPTCCLWGATSPSGDLIIYDSYYQRNRLISENCAEILKKSGNDVFEWTVIDPAVDRRDATTGTSYFDEYRKSGIVPLLKGQNAILDGISRIKELLRCDNFHKHPLTGRADSPYLHIFPACSELIQEIQQYRWKDQPAGDRSKSKEEPVDRHNHAIDALRYMAMQNPRSHEKAAAVSEWDRWQTLLDDIRGEVKIDDPYQIGGWIK
jgi:phage terminase large subunit